MHAAGVQEVDTELPDTVRCSEVYNGDPDRVRIAELVIRFALYVNGLTDTPVVIC